MKVIFSLFVVSFFVLGLSNCGGSKSKEVKYTLENNPPFILSEIYSQDWVSGIRNGGSGTIIYITFSDFTEDVIIKDIYFRRKKAKAQISPKNKDQYIGYFNKEEERDIIMDIDPNKDAQNTPVQSFPFQLEDNEAVISYIFKKEIHFFKLVKIAQRPIISYPETNPKKN